MKIAVVGAGISGLGAAWLLAQKHETSLFESADRLGGHAHTVQISDPKGAGVAMDTGFLVYNELTYPHLTAFFRALKVETVASEMSLSVQVEEKKLEWAGNNLNTIFGQRLNLLKPRFHKMLFEILRFGREAEENLAMARRHAWTLGELLKARNYAAEFAGDYLLPIGAAIWSTPESKMIEFPAATFLTFFINHRLLQVNNRPQWKTVKNGSIEYVRRAAAQIPHVFLSSPVLEVERRSDKVLLRTPSGTEEFDRVVLATHAPITAKILTNQTEQEQKILSAIAYESNRTLLHLDPSVMPKRRRCWSAWNVRGVNAFHQPGKVSLSYYLNQLQPLKTSQDYFVTLNPDREPQGILREFDYAHPQFNQEAIRAQRDLPSIQGNGGVYFAGAWSRYGFHEDGLLSAVNVARLLGVETPWEAA